MSMTESAVENAMKEIASIRAAREAHMVRRAEMQRKAEAVMSRPPVYILKKYGGQQLALDLENHGMDAERGNAGATH